MERVFFYDFYKIERENKRWGFLISSVIHALLLLLILIKIFPMETEPMEDLENTIAVELLMPVKEIVQEPEELDKGGGSSAGPESEEPQEGGSEGKEAPPALEELEKQPNKIEVIKPTPIPATNAPKPILSAPEPQVVKVDPPRVETKPAPSKPAPVIVSEPVPSKPTVPENTSPSSPVEGKPKPSTPSGSGTSGHATTGDDDAPGSGGTGSGSGPGGSGAGGASTGSGPGGGGNQGSGTGPGSGDGVGVNFDETGPLKRKIQKRADVGSLAREYVQSVVFNICINREGKVTYLRLNEKLSKTKDKSFIREAQKKMYQYEFFKDMMAPKKECGTFTFKIDGVIYKLGN